MDKSGLASAIRPSSCRSEKIYVYIYNNICISTYTSCLCTNRGQRQYTYVIYACCSTSVCACFFFFYIFCATFRDFTTLLLWPYRGYPIGDYPAAEKNMTTGVCIDVISIAPPLYREQLRWSD